MRVLAVAVLLSSCGPELGTEPWAVHRDGLLTPVTGFGSNPGGLSLFIHAPTSLGSNVPLVVAMHGCGQTAEAYSAVGWAGLADQHRFLVAYPQTVANGGCFDWFSGNQQTRSGPQVTSIMQMVQHLVTTRGVDPSRVFVTGLSAGGAMTGVLLAVAPDVFSRGSVMAGLPFACATTQLQGLSCMSSPMDQTPMQWGALVRAVSGSNAAPRVSIFHGSSDTTVRPANMQEQVEQWTDVNAIDAIVDVTTTLGAATHREFRNAAGVTLVESWTIAGMGHGAAIDTGRACGTPGPFILDFSVCSSRHSAEFFGLIGVQPDAGTGGGGGGFPVGGGGGSVVDGGAGGGGGNPVGGGGGSVADGGAGGGGNPVGGGGGGNRDVEDGGGGSAIGGGGGAGSSTPTGCGCASVEPLALLLVALLFARRRDDKTPQASSGRGPW